MTPCTCTWKQEGSVPIMDQRDPDCERHGDRSRWWRRVEARRVALQRAVQAAGKR